MGKGRDAARVPVPAVEMADFPAADAENEDSTPLTLQHSMSCGRVAEEPNTAESHLIPYIYLVANIFCLQLQNGAADLTMSMTHPGSAHGCRGPGLLFLEGSVPETTLSPDSFAWLRALGYWVRYRGLVAGLWLSTGQRSGNYISASARAHESGGLMRKGRDAAARVPVPAVAIAHFPAADAEGEDFTPLTLQGPLSGGRVAKQPNTCGTTLPLCTWTPTCRPSVHRASGKGRAGFRKQ
ncbi:hypothetical protein H8959_006000 [Pygathrix nigripes]